MLASDGVANVGLTDADGIPSQISEDAAAGIELVAIGVGMGNYNDALLEQLADRGDGFYAYVDDLAETRRLFQRGSDRDPADRTIGAGHSVTALYVIRLLDDLIDAGSLGSVRLRWTEPGDRKVTRTTRDIDTGNLARSFRATAPTFQLDAIVAAAAEVLRESAACGGFQSPRRRGRRARRIGVAAPDRPGP